jgi:hypothetical protein
MMNVQKNLGKNKIIKKNKAELIRLEGFTGRYKYQQGQIS